jgi:hypothetical protein
MKKLILSIATFCFFCNANAQWSYKTMDNGFDETYKIAYTETDNSGYLKLENVNGKIVFYISGGYYCEDAPTVDLVFVVNGENKKYNIQALKSDNSKSVFFTFDLMNESFVEDFKKSSICKVRINESYCTSEIYSFSMGSSKTTLEFMLK